MFPYWIWLLKLKSATLFTANPEWEPALLTDAVKHETIITQELRCQVSPLIAHVEPVTLLNIGDKVAEACVSTWTGGLT